MIIHNALHMLTATVAVALFIISLLAYRRKHSSRFLYICAAFGVFAIKELLLAITFGIPPDPLHNIAHSMNLLILALFALGILR